MNTRDDLLQTICESPADDVPRLIFADWLEENGDPDRAEFIRVQCEIDSMDFYESGRRALVRRELELIQKFGEKWLRDDGLANIVEWNSFWSPKEGARFRRGFIDRLTLESPEEFLVLGQFLLARVPLLGLRLGSTYTIPAHQREVFENTARAIRIRQSGKMPTSLDSPRWNRFPEPTEFSELIESPWFGRLQEFLLDTPFADSQHIRLLASSSGTENLRELDLSGNETVDGEGWRVLGFSDIFHKLQSLRLDGCNLEEAGLRAVLHSKHLRGVRQLSLARLSPELAPDLFRLLYESDTLSSLQEVNLSNRGIGAEELHLLGAWPGLCQITRLDLTGFWATEEDSSDVVAAWKVFASSSRWGNLQELNLDFWSLPCLEALLDSSNLRTLRVLTLENIFRDARTMYSQKRQNEAAKLLCKCANLAESIELQFPEGALSVKQRADLRDRFGDNLVYYPEGLKVPRTPEEWSSGRPPLSTFLEVDT